MTTAVTHTIPLDAIMPSMISYYTYKNWVNRGKIEKVNRACNGKSVDLKFNSLPPHIQELVIVRMPEYNPNKIESLADHIYIDGDAVRYYANYEKDGRGLSMASQEKYVTNVNVLKGMIQWIGERTSFIRARMGSTKQVQKQVILEAIGLRDILGHTLPTHPDRLRKTLNEFKERGYECLISMHEGNSRASKTNTDDSRAVLETLIGKHNNFDNEQIASIYNTMATTMGWKEIVAGTVANVRKTCTIYTEGGRRGTKELYDTKLMQVKRSAPSSAMLYWTLDGWKVELMYQSIKKDVKGKDKPTYHNRLVLEMVLDPCTLYPIGYAISEGENKELVKKALGNAIQHSKELFGQYYIPYQIQSDNYGRKDLTKWYAVACKHYTPARVGNAKAKVIEPYFAYLNRTYCQLENNWSGHNLTARVENQPNREFALKTQKSVPDRNGAIKQIIAFVEKERATKRDAYLEAWKLTKPEHKQVLTVEEYLYHFGTRSSDTTVAMAGAGLMPRVNGERKYYDSFDKEFRTRGIKHWKVLYNPADTYNILAVSEDDHYKFLLTEKHAQPMALADMKEGDGEKLEAVKAINRAFKEDILTRNETNFNRVVHLVEEASEIDPENEELYEKFFGMVDSTGQHKDLQTKARIKGKSESLKTLKKDEDTEVSEEYEFDVDSYVNDRY
jgi:hypothetical protein